MLIQEITLGNLEEIHSLLIARHGTLLYEGYFASSTGPDELHVLNSATKSVMSSVVGAALGKGLIRELDQSIAEFFPEYRALFDEDPDKLRITLRHVLTMTAGLEWDQKHPSERDRDGVRIFGAPDAVRYILEKPLSMEPGTHWLYSGGCSLLLSAIVRSISGMEADAYAEEVLFEPLGISAFQWKHLGDGTADADGGLSMRARDLAKIGQLILQEGLWEGEQVLPPGWVQDATTAWIQTDNPSTKYGFQWWLDRLSEPEGGSDPTGVVQASGYGGQKLFIIPRYDLVIVFFGCSGTYECGASDTVPSLALYNYILRSVRDAV